METNNKRYGTLKVIGLGPGDIKWMCEEAILTIKKAQVICGYKTYIELVKELIQKHQKIIQTGMTKEKDRVQLAIDEALNGNDTVLVCSGDPGIYGLSGLVLELLKKRKINTKDLKFEIIPGIPALSACAAILGAPLIHDFSVISLSDLLTPWSLIEKRLKAAAVADFVICIYNPRSKKRKKHLPKALEIIWQKRPKDVPVGIVTRAMRKGQEKKITTLLTLMNNETLIDSIGMQSLLIIGNSSSFIHEDMIITPRGYEI